MFNIGVESYSYHRYFGELRYGEKPTKNIIDICEFVENMQIKKINSLGIQTCFIDYENNNQIEKLNNQLINRNFELVISWGHPTGIELGENKLAFADLLEKLKWAKYLNAEHFRFVIDGPTLWKKENNAVTLKRVIPLIKEITMMAADLDINVSIENHGGLQKEIYNEIFSLIDSHYLGMTFDIGNFIRTGENIFEAFDLFKDKIYVVHIKDFELEGLKPGEPNGWWPTVALGQGDLPLERILRKLLLMNFNGPILIELMASNNSDEIEDMLITESIDFLIEQRNRHRQVK